MTAIEDARRWFAEELRYTAPVRNCVAIIDAFASVPRERFVGPGPWRILSSRLEGWATPDADPRHLYHNILVVIDEARGVNTGEPQLRAFLYDQLDIARGERLLHVGAGTGYYSAILAELVGSSGRVIAVEYDAELAERAGRNLAPWPQVEAVHGDGTRYEPRRVDVIVVNAGVTHPSPVWLDALPVGGRLLFPLTANNRWGAFLKVVRHESGYAARFVGRTGIFHCTRCRDDPAGRRLEQAFRRSKGGLPPVQSLHRDTPPAGSRSCWFSGPGFWLSKRPVREAV